MKRFLLLTTALLLACVTLVSAQSRGSYFFENSLLRSKLNPAFAPQSTYLSVPVAGSLSLDAASNFGLGNFVFPRGDKNCLFLHPDVPATDFLSKLPAKDPYLKERLETDLLGAGMPVGSYGYATVSLSFVENGSALLPGDLLRFAKVSDTGIFNGRYDDFRIHLMGYTSLAAGYSHDMEFLLPGLRLGGRVKLLVGLAAANVSIQQIDLQFGPEMVAARTLGGGSLSGITYDPVEGFQLMGLGLRGIGAAVDLGASWRLSLDGFVDGVEVSASACDLGGIHYNRSLTRVDLDGSLSFSGISDFSGDLQEQLNELFTELGSLTHFQTSEGKGFGCWLSPSFHAGAAATFWQHRLNAGLLYYHTVGHDNLMASVGASPLEWLNLGVNWTFLGPAQRFGFFAEYIPRRYVGLFVGMERASWRTNNRLLPIGNATTSLSLGLNILFGDYSFWQ